MEHLSEWKTLGSLSPWKDPTEMFVNFIYYRMLVNVAIFHGIIKGMLLHSLKARHCLHAAKIETPLMFQIPPPHSPIVIIIYIFTQILHRYIYLFLPPHPFAHLATADQNWWKVVDVTKALKGIWIFIRNGAKGREGFDLRARQAVSSQRNGGKITAIFTLMITFKLISISWRDVETVNWHIYYFSIYEKLFNTSFSDLFDKIIHETIKNLNRTTCGTGKSWGETHGPEYCTTIQRKKIYLIV